jgi:predicted AAA+ superfamily ATPase
VKKLRKNIISDSNFKDDIVDIIDFYVPTENLAIQVSMQVLDNIDTKERETGAFVKLKNYLTDTKCILITNSEEAVIECEGMEIDVVPAWKWLLEE